MSKITEITLRSGRKISKETILSIADNLVRQQLVYDDDSGINVIDELIDDAFTVNDEPVFTREDAEELVTTIEYYVAGISEALEELLAAKM